MNILKYGGIVIAILWVFLVGVSRFLIDFFQRNPSITEEQFRHFYRILSISLIYLMPLLLSVLNGYRYAKQKLSSLNCFIRSGTLSFPGFVALWTLFVLSESHLLNDLSHILHPIKTSAWLRE